MCGPSSQILCLFAERDCQGPNRYMEDGNGVGVGNGVNVGIGVSEAIGNGADIEGVGVPMGNGVGDSPMPGEPRAFGTIDVSLQAISVSAARAAINIFMLQKFRKRYHDIQLMKILVEAA